MGFLFSTVTLSARENKPSFLVSGNPHRVENTGGHNTLKRFLEDSYADHEIKICADAYQYGEGASTAATREELGYVKMQMDLDKDFLKGSCKKVDSVIFPFRFLPEDHSTQNDNVRG